MQGEPLGNKDYGGTSYIGDGDPGAVGGGTYTNPTDGGRLPTITDYENIFGPAGRDVKLDMQRNKRHARWHLPDALRGYNLYLTDRIDGLITDTTNSPFTSIILPYKYIENVDQKIKWNSWSFDEGLASRVPYESAARTLTQTKRSYSGYTVRHGLAITMEHNFMMSPKGRENFYHQLKQVVGSIQYTNDIDVHIALITARSYAKERAERYYTSSKTSHQVIREYVDLFGFLAKNPNAMDIMIEEAKATLKLWGSQEPTFMLTNSKLTFQMTMNPDKTQYFTQGIDGVKRLRNGPNIGSYRGLSIINSRSFEMESGAPPRDVLRRRVRVAEYYRIPYEEGIEGRSFAFYDESKDAWQKFTWHQLFHMSLTPEVMDERDAFGAQQPRGRPTTFPFIQNRVAVPGGAAATHQTFFSNEILTWMENPVHYLRPLGGADVVIADAAELEHASDNEPWWRMAELIVAGNVNYLDAAGNIIGINRGDALYRREAIAPMNEPFDNATEGFPVAAVNAAPYTIRHEVGIPFGLDPTDENTFNQTKRTARTNFYKYLWDYMFEDERRRYLPKLVRDFFYRFRWNSIATVRAIVTLLYPPAAVAGAAALPDLNTNVRPYVAANKVELVVVRPCIEHNMLGIIMGRGGLDELGATLWGQTELSCYDDSMHGIWGMSYKYNERAIVINERNLIRLWDVAYDGYNGGKDCTHVDWTSDDAVDRFREQTYDINTAYEGPSMMVMSFKVDQGSEPWPSPIVFYDGHFTKDRMTLDGEQMHNIKIDNFRIFNRTDYRDRYQHYFKRMPDFVRMHNQKPAGTASEENETSVCSFAFQGTMRVYNDQGTMINEVTGNGHHGQDYVGVASVRAGKGMRPTPMQPITSVSVV